MQLLRLLGPYVVWLYPIGILILLIYLRNWLMANRDLRASLFTLERESAVQRMRRAASGAFCTFGLLLGFFFVQFFMLRTLNWDEIIHPTPTPDFDIPRVGYVETPATPVVTPDPRTPSPTVSPTPSRRPTVREATLVPTGTPTVPPQPVAPANCPTEGVYISQPAQGATVSGRIDIRGTANIPKFNFYKIELGLGDQPSRWTSIGDLHHTPVTDGLLDVLDTSGLPAGAYSIRLVVVDITGNYPPPCEIRIVVGH